jgi:hypothetical protein
MFKWLFELLYGSTAAEFPSSYGISESVQRLRAATKRSTFSAIGEQAAVGKVTEESVRLQRVIPMVRNSFKPFFVGRFEAREGATVLCGRFSMMPSTKVFMTFWLSMVLFFAFAMPIFGARSPQGAPGFAALIPIFMLCAGIGLIALGKWLSRNDVGWLSKVIEGALVGRTGSAALGAVSEEAPGVKPALALKIASAMLAGGGVVTLLSLAILPAKFPLGVHPPGLPRDWAQACAVSELILALGVWRRSLWAWWGVFGLLALAGTLLWSVFWVSDNPTPVLFKAIFGFFSMVVMVMWAMWWYAQRKHFVQGDSR